MVVKGKRLTLKERYQRFKEEIHDMTPKQKWEHFWEYYKWTLGILFGLIVIVLSTIASINSLNMEIRIAGALVNVDVSPDGYVQLQEGFFEYVGAEEDKETVDLHNMQFADPYTTLDQTYALDVQETILALINAQQLDYLLYDELALPFFMDPETMLDLRELFTEDALVEMGSAVIWLEMPETGERIPMAIDITDTVFFQTYMETPKPIYLSFSVLLPRQEACRQLWQFIKGGDTDGLQTVLAGTVVDTAVFDEINSKKTAFFTSQGYITGDHRLELTKQSFQLSDSMSQEDVQAVQSHVQASLDSGALDYVVASAEALQSIRGLSDLRDILTTEQMDALGEAVVNWQGVPVAVDLKAAGITEEEAFLAFSANSTRMEVCKAFYGYLTEK